MLDTLDTATIARYRDHFHDYLNNGSIEYVNGEPMLPSDALALDADEYASQFAAFVAEVRESEGR